MAENLELPSHSRPGPALVGALTLCLVTVTAEEKPGVAAIAGGAAEFAVQERRGQDGVRERGDAGAF